MRFLYSPLVANAHLFQLRLEVLLYFFLCNTTDGCVFWKEADVGEIVLYGEEGDLRKLGDTRDEYDSFVLVISFQNGKYLAIYFRAFLMLRSFPRVLERRVVFVNEDGNL